MAQSRPYGFETIPVLTDRERFVLGRRAAGILNDPAVAERIRAGLSARGALGPHDAVEQPQMGLTHTLARFAQQSDGGALASVLGRDWSGWMLSFLDQIDRIDSSDGTSK